jgi:hypothetical protein
MQVEGGGRNMGEEVEGGGGREFVEEWSMCVLHWRVYVGMVVCLHICVSVWKSERER